MSSNALKTFGLCLVTAGLVAAAACKSSDTVSNANRANDTTSSAAKPAQAPDAPKPSSPADAPAVSRTTEPAAPATVTKAPKSTAVAPEPAEPDAAPKPMSAVRIPTLDEMERELVAAWENVRTIRATIMTGSVLKRGDRWMRSNGLGDYLFSTGEDRLSVRSDILTASNWTGEDGEPVASAGQHRVLRLIKDGNLHWFSDKTPPGKATRSKLRSGSTAMRFGGAAFFRRLRSAYELKPLAPVMVDGRMLYVIEGARGGSPAVRMQFDPESGIRINSESLGGDGSVIRYMTLTDVKVNETIEASEFEFDIPESVTVEERS